MLKAYNKKVFVCFVIFVVIINHLVFSSGLVGFVNHV